MLQGSVYRLFSTEGSGDNSKSKFGSLQQSPDKVLQLRHLEIGWGVWRVKNLRKALDSGFAVGVLDLLQKIRFKTQCQLLLRAVCNH